ncbi:MAG: hypothetical protein V4857_14580 [Pseudomonadota bacterium]
MRLILGEMGPLLDRFDAASKVMKDGHALFEKDLHALGAFMGRIEAVLQEAAESAEALRQLYARPTAPVDPVKRLKTPGAASVPVKYLVMCSIASSAMVLAGMLVFNKTTIEQARVGHAILGALPYLDQATKQKLEAAIKKSAN